MTIPKDTLKVINQDRMIFAELIGRAHWQSSLTELTDNAN